MEKKEKKLVIKDLGIDTKEHKRNYFDFGVDFNYFIGYLGRIFQRLLKPLKTHSLPHNFEQDRLHEPEDYSILQSRFDAISGSQGVMQSGKGDQYKDDSFWQGQGYSNLTRHNKKPITP